MQFPRDSRYYRKIKITVKRSLTHVQGVRLNHTIFDLEGEARGVVAVGTTPSRGRASTSYVFMAEHMQCARLWLPVGSHGLLGEVPQARLLDDIGEPHEPGLLGTENFAD